MNVSIPAARVLLTGSGGFVGRALLNNMDGWGVQTANRMEWMTGKADLEGVQIVVHLAARVHVMRDLDPHPLAAFRAANVDGTMRLATQAANAGVKRFVYVSSIKVNGESTLPGQCFTEADTPNPQDAYGQSKYEAEFALRQLGNISGMEITIIRPPLVYGPGVKANFESLMHAVQRGWPLPLAAVTSQRSFVALDNLVDFLLTCMAHPLAANQTFLVSDDDDLTICQLLRGLGDASGRPARLWSVPVGALKIVAALVGKKEAMHRLCSDLRVDISKARTVLAWKPPISVNEGLFRAVGKVGRG
jgi:nucleoside-diphosphate-sugar epimerase